MRNLKFDQDTNNLSYKNATNTGMVGFLVKKGIVTNTTQANILLLLITIVCIGVIVVLRFDQDDSIHNRPATQEEIELVGSALEDSYYDTLE